MTASVEGPELAHLRAGKPASYPDQAIHAAFACARLGLAFEDADGDSGLLFRVAAPNGRTAVFGGGRCSFYPQNTAMAATLAADKYLAARALNLAGIANLGGDYFFLHPRHHALRPAGHERADAFACLERLGGRAFAKPLHGSRGDFAEVVDGPAALETFLDAAASAHDAVLLQPVVEGDEYRVFVLDGAVLYCARKWPASLEGDGVRPLRALLAERSAQLAARGISSPPAAVADGDYVPAKGERVALPGRMNRSAGGVMTMEPPPDAEAAFDLARRAVAALGLRVGGVDLFVRVADAPHLRVIEVNANPSIRFLEDSGRDDLILAIWRSAFAQLGLIDV